MKKFITSNFDATLQLAHVCTGVYFAKCRSGPPVQAFCRNLSHFQGGLAERKINFFASDRLSCTVPVKGWRSIGTTYAKDCGGIFPMLIRLTYEPAAGHGKEPTAMVLEPKKFRDATARLPKRFLILNPDLVSNLSTKGIL